MIAIRVMILLAGHERLSPHLTETHGKKSKRPCAAPPESPPLILVRTGIISVRYEPDAPHPSCRHPAGTGFQTHPHQDMEIVTWVLSGELEHKDSVGNRDIIYPGLAQRMSAGTGIWHSEMNPRHDRPVHLVQMWVLPDTERVTPGYQQLDIGAELDKGGLVPVASGRGHDAAIAIRQRGAVLWAGRLKPGETVRLPDAPYLHLYVARGTAELEGAGALATGDAARLTAAGTPVPSAIRLKLSERDLQVESARG